ncbi:MAG: hypothetical protein WBP59_05740 [Ilumatobacteraceae bacterium]
MPDTPVPPSAQSTRVVIRPWIDPVVDDDGHDPRSRYVETFWLSVLGPTATWTIRRLVAGLEQSPEGYHVDLGAFARSMGLSYSTARTSPFSKALQRCVMFGVAHPIEGGLAVRRRIPAVSVRHLRRMPEDVQALHRQWAQTTVTLDDLTRAHELATTMLEYGDDAALIEHRLVALGVRDAVAAEAADNAYRLRQAV